MIGGGEEDVPLLSTGRVCRRVKDGSRYIFRRYLPAYLPTYLPTYLPKKYLCTY